MLVEYSTDERVKEVIKLLKNYRFSLHDEKTLQRQIHSLLNNLPCLRKEVKLSEESIIDFLYDTVGIEVKIKGNKVDVFKQLERYCSLDQVQAIVLVTGMSMGVPPLIKGKPCYVVNLSLAWL